MVFHPEPEAVLWKQPRHIIYNQIAPGTKPNILSDFVQILVYISQLLKGWFKYTGGTNNNINTQSLCSIWLLNDCVWINAKETICWAVIPFRPKHSRKYRLNNKTNCRAPLRHPQTEIKLSWNHQQIKFYNSSSLTLFSHLTQCRVATNDYFHLKEVILC